MKTKIFPRPAPAPKEQEQQEEPQIDYYPWMPRVLAVLAGGCLWGLAFVLIFCVWISGNDSFGDVCAAFTIGFMIPVIFSIPFLWK